MNKILSGFIGLVMVVAVVGGTAYALYSDTTTVNGIEVTTGNADLKIWNYTEFADEWNVNDSIEGLYPGQQIPFEWKLKNDSKSEIGLDVVAKLTSATGDWAVLSPKIYMKVDLGGASTGWKTLAEWNAGDITLPGGTLAHGTVATYAVTFYVDSGAGNEIASKALHNVTFVVTGTQH